MRFGLQLKSLALAWLAWFYLAVTVAAEMGWQDAVDTLTEQKGDALNCAEMYLKNQDGQKSPQGQLVYGEARAGFNGAVAGQHTVRSSKSEIFLL